MQNNLPAYLQHIPKHWEVKKLKYVFDFQVGWTPSTTKQSSFEGENIWVTIGDMQSKYIDSSEIQISDEAINESRIKKVPKGSLMYSFKLSIGKIAFADIDLYTNEAIFSILPTEQYDLRFFYYSLPLDLIFSANENIYGAKILNQELINNALLHLPPLPEQRAIADYLDCKTAEIDGLITKKTHLIELLKEEEKAFINEKLEIKDKRLEIKDGEWQRKKLKYLVQLRNEKIAHEEAKKYTLKLALENIEGHTGRIIETENELSFEGEGRLFYENDVLFNKLRPYLSKYHLAEKAGVCYGELLIFIPNQEIILPKFLYYLVSSQKFIHHVDGSTYGSKMPRASWEDFISNFSFFISPLPTQARIVGEIEAHLGKSRAIGEKLQREIGLLKEYRQSLISEAVTGGVSE